MNLTFTIANQKITASASSLIASDSAEYLTASFTFSSDWDGFAKTAIFTYDDSVCSGTYTNYEAILTGDACTIPWEVIKFPGFTVSVFGISGDTRITTDISRIFVTQSGYAEGETPEPPTPDVYEQLLERSVPDGGTTGQALIKESDTDFDLTWGTPAAVATWGEIVGTINNQTDLMEQLDLKIDLTQNDITKDPTGFVSPEEVIITGDQLTNTITLSGTTVEAYYRGILNNDLVDGYVSPAHPTTENYYFLAFDGTEIAWREISTITEEFYSNLLICVAWFNGVDWIYQRECHSLMPWQTHKELHNVIGTYRKSGGTVADYTTGSTTPANRRPSVSSVLIYDEDLPTTNPSLASGGTYTTFSLTGDEVLSINTTTSEIVPTVGSQAYFNELTGGLWQQAPMSNNYYTSIWLLAIPTCADAISQSHRFLWVQGQSQSSNINLERAKTISSLNLAGLTNLSPEFIFIARIIIRQLGGDWSISEVENISGTRYSQVSSPSGTYLSSVSTDSSLTGIGTPTNLLGINLSNSNSFVATQSYSTHPTFTIDTEIIDKKYVDDEITSVVGDINTALDLINGEVI